MNKVRLVIKKKVITEVQSPISFIFLTYVESFLFTNNITIDPIKGKKISRVNIGIFDNFKY